MTWPINRCLVLLVNILALHIQTFPETGVLHELLCLRYSPYQAILNTDIYQSSSPLGTGILKGVHD
jgi:hypothetical protein